MYKRPARARGEPARYFGAARNREHILSDLKQKALRAQERADERFGAEFAGMANPFLTAARQIPYPRTPAILTGRYSQLATLSAGRA